MENKIGVVIVDDIKETRNNVKTLLEFNDRIEVLGEAENGEEAIQIAGRLKPDIMLMDINMPVKDGIKASEEISVAFPEVSVIIVSVQGEQEYLRKAMAAGAREFITKPFSSDDLINAIIKVFEVEQKRKQKITPKVEEEVRSKVITVFSTKGGVGKTTIASNLAAAIARETRKKVAVVDLDLQFGNMGVFLNVPIKNTIIDLVKETSDFDSKLIEEYMVNHYSGAKVLLAPTKPEYAEFITSVHIEKIIKSLKETYHYIIIDTPTSLNEVTLTTLDLADKILFISGMDLPTIKNTKDGMGIMESLHYSKEKLHIVVNKATEQFGIKNKDFEDTVKYPIWASIPEDNQTVITSINKGFPFVLTRSETKVAKSILDMIDQLAGKKEKHEETEKGFLKGLFK